MHPFLITADGTMYVDVASATNSCQLKNRMLESPGLKQNESDFGSVRSLPAKSP
jgi:hypothetical protein